MTWAFLTVLKNAVERGVNGAFSRVFRSGIKAVDVTSALKRADG